MALPTFTLGVPLSLLAPTSEKRRKLTDKQETFLAELAHTMDVDSAMLSADYAPNSKREVIKSLKTEIIDIANGYLAMNAPKAVKQVTDVLDGTAQDLQDHYSSRYKAGLEVLDRVGIGKQSQVNIQAEVLTGIVLLPSKGVAEASVVVDVNAPIEG